jgi:hypothetical protein
MMWDHSKIENLSKVASAAQAIVLTTAVLIGGGWTLYVFNASLQIDNAKATLEKLQREIDAEPKIELIIELERLAETGDEKLIRGKLDVRNVGSANTILNLSDHPLTLYKLIFDLKGAESWIPVADLNLMHSATSTYGAIPVHAGTRILRPFMFSVFEPGVYVVKFSAVRTKSEAARVAAMEISPADKAVQPEWATHTYIWVR